jgi:mycofactocin precursor
VPAAGQAREATVTQQAVTVLVPEHPAPASEKPAEPDASGDGALVTGELLVEEISIDGCAVSTDAPVSRQAAAPGAPAPGFDLDLPASRQARGTARPGLRRQPARRLWF